MWFVHTGKMTNQRKLKTVSMQKQFVTDIFYLLPALFQLFIAQFLNIY